MPSPDLVKLFVRPLQDAGIRYMVSGSVAAAFYGEPRATLDVDIGVFLAAADVPRFAGLFPESEFYRPPDEVLLTEIQRINRGHFNLIHHKTGGKADFYPSRDHPYIGWALKNARSAEIGGTAIVLAPPEYVILWKLEFYREGKQEKHLRDIRGIVETQGDQLDRDLLEQAVKELRLAEEWAAVVSSFGSR